VSFESIEALYILTSTTKQRFEFIFTDYGTNPAHFASIFEVFKLYQATTVYRELKLRSAILTDGQLNILPHEQVYKQLTGIYNLSSDQVINNSGPLISFRPHTHSRARSLSLVSQGNLGVFCITNIRLVWYADANESFNISLPYMQIVSVRMRESKYGLALVIQTAHTAGNYVLGFRIDPQERLNEVFKEITSLFAVYGETPIFGVDYEKNVKVRLRLWWFVTAYLNLNQLKAVENLFNRKNIKINDRKNLFTPPTGKGRRSAAN
jgi:Bardet-Biedl syndrome 5 protein